MLRDTITAARRFKTGMRPIGCDAEAMEAKAEEARQKTRIDGAAHTEGGRTEVDTITRHN